MQDLAPFDVPHNVGRAVGMLLVILGAVGFGVLMGLGLLYDTMLARGAGWIVAVLLSVAAIAWARTVLQRQPLLVISTEGLEDRSLLGAGLVPWSEITQVRLWIYVNPIRAWPARPQKLTFLAADVHGDPKRFARHGTRWLRAVNRRMGSPPIAVPVNMFPASIGLPRVVQEIRRRSGVAIAPDLLALGGLS